MYQVNNRIDITSSEHLTLLKERFSQANQSMQQVPGFLSFRLLEAEDGSHIIAESVFKSKEDFMRWIESDHFKQAHARRSHNAQRANLANYYVMI